MILVTWHYAKPKARSGIKSSPNAQQINSGQGISTGVRKRSRTKYLSRFRIEKILRTMLSLPGSGSGNSDGENKIKK